MRRNEPFRAGPRMSAGSTTTRPSARVCPPDEVEVVNVTLRESRQVPPCHDHARPGRHRPHPSLWAEALMPHESNRYLALHTIAHKGAS